MPFVPIAMMVALVFAFVDFLKGLTNKDWNSVTTQLIGWAAGVAGVFIAGSSMFASEIKIGSQSLNALDSPTKLFVGLMIASTAKVAFDVKKALDGTDSAATPTLLPGAGVPAVTDEERAAADVAGEP